MVHSVVGVTSFQKIFDLFEKQGLSVDKEEIIFNEEFFSHKSALTVDFLLQFFIVSKGMP